MQRYEICVEPTQRVVRIYDREKGESSEGMTRYSASMLITDLGLGECRLHMVQGRLDNDINMQMFSICQQLGYSRVQFEVPAGTSASRLAKYQFTRDGLDRYCVEIPTL